VFKDQYCVVAYYPEHQNCDVYSFRTHREAERYVDGLLKLYGWAADVEWHIRPLSTPAVRKAVIKRALAEGPKRDRERG
jgi:hypothetical protein